MRYFSFFLFKELVKIWCVFYIYRTFQFSFKFSLEIRDLYLEFIKKKELEDLMHILTLSQTSFPTVSPKT